MIHETIKKNGITFGIITGIISALITATLYAIDLKFIVSGWYSFVNFLTFIVLGIVLLSKTKRDLKGELSFKEAFTTYFILILIGLLISVLFTILLFNVIDPSAKDTLQDIVIRNTVSMMRKFNSPTATVNEFIAKMKESDMFSPIEQIKGTIIYIVIYSILGLILAAFFKTKKSSQE